MKQASYRYVEIPRCEMCGAPPSDFKLLGKRLDKAQGRAPWKKKGVSTPIMKCRRCGLIFANPQPIPLDIQDHYGIPPEQYWHNPDVFEYKGEFNFELHIIRRLMKIRPGSKALDIGAGLGKSMITLDRGGFTTFGLEPSEPFYRKAIEKMGIDPQRLQLGMVESANYPEDEFDLITFGAVMEHLYNPGKAIAQAMAWLKPGGLIHIEVPSSRWLISRSANLYYKVMGSDYVANISPLHPPYHLYEFTHRCFEMHGERNGYTIAEYQYHVCNTYLPGILDAVARPYMKWTDSGMQLVIWLRKKG